MHFVSGLLTEGYVKGKPMVYGGRLNYATSSHCANQGLSGKAWQISLATSQGAVQLKNPGLKMRIA